MAATSLTQRDIDRALAGAVKLGLVIRRYRVTADAIEVETVEPQPDALPASLIDWSRPK